MMTQGDIPAPPQPPAVTRLQARPPRTVEARERLWCVPVLRGVAAAPSPFVHRVAEQPVPHAALLLRGLVAPVAAHVVGDRTKLVELFGRQLAHRLRSGEGEDEGQG